MGLRESFRDNRLAISACCLSVLGAMALFTRSWRDSPTPRPVALPRPAGAPGKLPPPLKLTLAAVKADAASGVAGLQAPRVIIDPGKGHVIAYYVAEDSAAPQDRLRAGVQRAWVALRPQLPRTGPMATAHLIVLRSAEITYAGEPPAGNDPMVLAHGVAKRAGVDMEWTGPISEWR